MFAKIVVIWFWVSFGLFILDFIIFHTQMMIDFVNYFYDRLILVDINCKIFIDRYLWIRNLVHEEVIVNLNVKRYVKFIFYYFFNCHWFYPLRECFLFLIFDYITPSLRVCQIFVLSYSFWQFLPKCLMALIFSLNLAFSLAKNVDIL